jgi:hypothetical protein
VSYDTDRSSRRRRWWRPSAPDILIGIAILLLVVGNRHGANPSDVTVALGILGLWVTMRVERRRR